MGALFIFGDFENDRKEKDDGQDPGACDCRNHDPFSCAGDPAEITDGRQSIPEERRAELEKRKENGQEETVCRNHMHAYPGGSRASRIRAGFG